jgi:hypothetical protein
MSNIRIIIEILILVFLVITTALTLIMAILAKTKKTKYFFLTICLIFGFLLVYTIISIKLNRNKAIKKISGIYKLEQLDCKKCRNCYVFLYSNRTYDIIIQHDTIKHGRWKLRFEGDVGFYPEIDNGPEEEVITQSNRTISYIGKTDCCIEACKNESDEKFRGMVIDKIKNESDYNLSYLVILTNDMDTIRYQRKHWMLPDLFNRFEINDEIIKVENHLDYIKIQPTGDTIRYHFNDNCKERCDIDTYLEKN